MDILRLLKPQTVAIIGASESNNYGGFTSKHFLDSCPERIENGSVFL